MSRKLAVLLDACSLPAFPIPMFGTLGISILLPEPRCVRLWTFLDSIVQLRPLLPKLMPLPWMLAALLMALST